MELRPPELDAKYAAPFGLVMVIRTPEGWDYRTLTPHYNLRSMYREMMSWRSGERIGPDYRLVGAYVCHGVIEIPVPPGGIPGSYEPPPAPNV